MLFLVLTEPHLKANTDWTMSEQNAQPSFPYTVSAVYMLDLPAVYVGKAALVLQQGQMSASNKDNQNLKKGV